VALPAGDEARSAGPVQVLVSSFRTDVVVADKDGLWSSTKLSPLPSSGTMPMASLNG
jgi:hypothetical protein